MNREFNRPLEEIVRERKSVRTYSAKALTEDERKSLEEYMARLFNPFSAKVRFKFIESETAAEGVKLGTYGMIAGADTYIGSAVEKRKTTLRGWAMNLKSWCSSPTRWDSAPAGWAGLSRRTVFQR
jgi:hypothetical protein